jgi:hypothetical protein
MPFLQCYKEPGNPVSRFGGKQFGQLVALTFRNQLQ